MTNIPLFRCDLDDEVHKALTPIFRSGALAAGPAVGSLEAAMSARLGRDAVAMSDASHALMLALKLAGVEPGSDVLTLSFNCLGSTTPITNVGATPVWVDVTPGTAQMSVEDARAAITPRTRAIVVYHVAGYPAPISDLRELARESGVKLIEDANAALGAITPEGPAGALGDFGVISFYANRLVNGVDGAVLVCGTPADAERARKLRRYGVDAPRFRDAWGEIDPSADVPQIGMYAPMTNVNAALALGNLSRAEDRLARIRANAAALAAGLQDLPGNRVLPAGKGESSFWTCLVMTEQRDRVMYGLKAAGVQASKLHHPNHEYSGFGARSRDLPGTMLLARQLLALPCGWWVTSEEISQMVSLISELSTTGPET